jgi:tRNA A37 threonylcarbamoyladenosine synthetase subunit TsaC/SUA5/YrdC
VDLIIDGGPCGLVPTTVIDMTQHEPVITRQGSGSADLLETV